ncbi:glycogen/starch/alpha-glucan phosphorylase [Lactiplantibacillus paraplantarum]|uniref:Alpha-1,4 glucan phosphorylase n=1 Tax=Lactiplantibacillus paraplantarum TaxID=60520 RepID=A0AAD0TM28_9LACO|nr:glycogen/starch/alpha-glucan phosphorylase [Lactiplantibacillus paraplantarum]AVW09059.1 glycogen/starch/alpha-glucan family phosphorylase [Lactiplantibacillus paraplantarum]AYJ37324.1 glycogen/starch/alpha-glucan family phosphorylase [Lactiplantibacillus paraplantarum]ERL45342.1 glycogen phosphorylase [Lactiplantibacillus paraplantarum]MCU4682270.1 glycogen/starch/alpha-glucan phosphorylase [Lactiplantibacillus paraplantarum]MDL2060968.1 glycogen/starch/alpha-glucan phosphorylase [Lactipla
MKLTTAQFKKDFLSEIETLYSTSLDDTTTIGQFIALGQLVRRYNSQSWTRTAKLYREHHQKQVYYFSIEFLPGRLLASNLLNLNLLSIVRKGLKELGLDFETISRSEPDPALGNGGLGRLAACYMDAMASLKIAGNGNGIRYRYGLFKQVFMDGYQVELPDDWLHHGNVWETRRDNKSCIVRFGGNVWLQPQPDGSLQAQYENTDDVLAVPYDVGIVGYHNDITNTLRLWSAELPPSVTQTYYSQAQRDRISEISKVLYPDDSNSAGQQLRLRQEYFFSSAGVQSIVRDFCATHHGMRSLGKKIAIHINDTHPTLVIPEMMRLLMDEHHCSWDVAWTLTTQVMSYTNHTILQEALETWPIGMFQGLLPRIYQIIVEIDRRYRAQQTPIFGKALVDLTAPLGNGQVRMAHLAVIGSHSVNGVAPLHTELLKTDVLRGLYQVYPERFNNKTNGIATRRWVQLANQPLSQLIDQTIGSSWRRQPDLLQTLLPYQQDDHFLHQLAQVKLTNKQALAAYVQRTMGIKLRTDAIYDVQIKRLHAYKRQLLHVFEILREYFVIKDHPDQPVVPRVHIFGAKAAPSYHYAKAIIKLINVVADMVNQDPVIGDRLKVVFIPNYGVSIAELIIPAADVSEQISTASKEASGTSNMKLMANGALSLATYDGANIDIMQAAGAENEYPFGLRVHEVYDYYQRGNYRAAAFYNGNPELKRILDSLINGTIPGIPTVGREIYDSLIRYNDEFFVLADYQAYVKQQQQISQDFQDQPTWQQRALANIAASGHFAADLAVARYADDIWQVPHDRLN